MGLVISRCPTRRTPRSLICRISSASCKKQQPAARIMTSNRLKMFKNHFKDFQTPYLEYEMENHFLERLRKREPKAAVPMNTRLLSREPAGGCRWRVTLALDSQWQIHDFCQLIPIICNKKHSFIQKTNFFFKKIQSFEKNVFFVPSILDLSMSIQ